MNLLFINKLPIKQPIIPNISRVELILRYEVMIKINENNSWIWVDESGIPSCLFRIMGRHITVIKGLNKLMLV